MNFDARRDPETTSAVRAGNRDASAVLAQRIIYSFSSHFSALFQLACAQCRAALKPMGCSLVPFPKAYHGSLLMAETGLDLFCGFMGSLTFSPFMGVWLPQAFHCSTKRLFFSLSQKWYSRYKRYSKSLKQLHFPSCDYSMTKQGIEEVISDIQ